jgi:hypothetical protein
MNLSEDGAVCLGTSASALASSAPPVLTLPFIASHLALDLMRRGPTSQAGTHGLGQGPRDGEQLLLLSDREVAKSFGYLGAVLLPSEILSLQPSVADRNQRAASVGGVGASFDKTVRFEGLD